MGKKESYKVTSTLRIWRGIITLALSISTLGILFKFQSWPLASIQLGVGLLELNIIAIISIMKLKKSTDNYHSNILKRVVIMSKIGLCLVVIPNKTLLNMKYPYHPEFIKAIIEAQANSDNQELQDKMVEEREKSNHNTDQEK